MKYDCSICFNRKYYPLKAIEDVCNFCKEHNGRFYKPDLTDIKGYVIDVVKEKGDE